MVYTVHQAKTHFSRLLREVAEGKEVVIAKGKTPVARLVAAEKPKREPGWLKGQIWAAPDAFDPLTDEELKDWGID